jgi:hypothetical protein
MRHPLRKAFWCFLAAGIGALCATWIFTHDEAVDEVLLILLVGPSLLAIPVGIGCGCVSLLASHGEFRLRRGVGRIASWEVPAAEWEEFRRFNTVRAAEGANLASGYAPRPADGRNVEVMFGRRQVLVDDYYCRLHRFALPELIGVNWLERQGEPECLEFGLLSTSETSSVRTALRVPVPTAAREVGVQIFYHFQKAVPKPRVGLAFRRPWLVIGSSLGLAATGLLVAGVAWPLPRSGDHGDAVVLVVAIGIATAIAATVVAVLIFFIVRPWRTRG